MKLAVPELGDYLLVVEFLDVPGTPLDMTSATFAYEISQGPLAPGNRPAAQNQRPVADAGADVTSGESLVTLGGGASYDPDPDGAIVFHSWQWEGGGATGVAPRLTLPMDATTAVTLTVVDDLGATASDEVLVTISSTPPPPNQAPSANAGADQNVADGDGQPGETVTLDGAGSSDSDGTIVAYAWSWNGGSASGVSPSVDVPDGSIAITLAVTDDKGATGEDTVVVVASAPPPLNQPPTADAGPDQTVVLDGTTVNLSGGGTDDAGPLGFGWAFVKVPRKSALTDADLAASAAASFTPDRAGDYTLELTVTDQNGLSAADTMVVTVQKPPKSGGGGSGGGGGGGKPSCNKKNPL